MLGGSARLYWAVVAAVMDGEEGNKALPKTFWC